MEERVIIQEVNESIIPKLSAFLNSLSSETKSYFAPHSFDEDTLQTLVRSSNYQLYISLDTPTKNITAYFVLRQGYFDYEQDRFSGYACNIDEKRDWHLAPVVGDQYQSTGIGGQLFTGVLKALEKIDINQLVLWGGVQAKNTRAIKFYEKFGFKKVGEYEYYGLNIEMIKSLNT